ncbi:MAG: hypothetical protein E7662_08155 [Ruminococcaceae bacterium]|nr:hypothetical protein [Oscillospiraceae bacterium]
MKLTTAAFLREKINHSLPGLDRIPALLNAGNLNGAEAEFAVFLKNFLRPEKYFRIPYYGPENAWIADGETEADVAARLARGKVMSVGFMHDFGKDGIRFEANPTSNEYREWTWQLNRHHEWRMLGHLYRETDDEKYPELFAKLFSSWREQCECPDDAAPGQTKAFRTIEIGIRLTKIWHYAIHAFLHSPSISDHLWCDIFASLWENANRLRLHPSHGNWLVMEMAGLFHSGLLYPFIPDAADWKQYAADRLTAELDVQIYPDSFQYELTTGYHGVVISNYSYAVDICNAMEQPLPPAFLSVMKLAFDLYPKLAQPDLLLPSLNDGGCPSAVSTSRLGLSYFPDKEDLRFFASDRTEGEPMFPKDTVMPYSGMAVLRDDWTAQSQWLFFESAPFGRGHQHEDKLSILLYAYGKNLLRDTGNFAYDSSEMRRFVLSSRGHNTAMVDGMEQNRRGRYRWAEEDIRKLSDLSVQLGDERDILDGIYDEGYGRDYLAVTHRRRVIKVKNNPLGLKTFYIVLDRFTAPAGGSHRYDIHWQLEEVPIHLTRTGSLTRLEADYGDNVTLTMLSDGAPTLRCGCDNPFMGWRTPGTPSPRSSEQPAADSVNRNRLMPGIPAPSVMFSASGEDISIVTLLYPSDNGCPITSVKLDGSQLTVYCEKQSWESELL